MLVDSVRAFKQRMKLGRFNPEEQEKKDEEKKKKEEEEAAAIAAMKVGDRWVNLRDWCKKDTYPGRYIGLVKLWYAF